MRVVAVLTLLLAASTLASGADKIHSSRTYQFLGGRAVVEKYGTKEHVLIQDTKGSVTAESECEGPTGSYDQIVAFITALKAVVTDKKKVSALFSYPLTVNEGNNKHRQVSSREELEHGFNEVFTPHVLEEIAKAEPHNVFCRNDMAMTGNGVVWSTRDNDGVLKGVVINQ